MAHELPALPYAKDALEPHISAETLDYHHDKHHAAYVTNLNNLIPGTEFEKMSLEDIVKKAPAGGIFNNAAQVWNHTFYFNGMGPGGGGEPTGAIAGAIKKSFGSFAEFKEKFSKSAVTNFGSGWTWLVKNSKGGLEIVNTDDADSALKTATPLLTVDVWEHAYYVDKRNARPAYIESWWNLVNWDFVNKNFGGVDSRGNQLMEEGPPGAPLLFQPDVVNFDGHRNLGLGEVNDEPVHLFEIQIALAARKEAVGDGHADRLPLSGGIKGGGYIGQYLDAFVVVEPHPELEGVDRGFDQTDFHLQGRVLRPVFRESAHVTARPVCFRTSGHPEYMPWARRGILDLGEGHFSLLIRGPQIPVAIGFEVGQDREHVSGAVGSRDLPGQIVELQRDGQQQQPKNPFTLLPAVPSPIDEADHQSDADQIQQKIREQSLTADQKLQKFNRPAHDRAHQCGPPDTAPQRPEPVEQQSDSAEQDDVNLITDRRDDRVMVQRAGNAHKKRNQEQGHQYGPDLPPVQKSRGPKGGLVACHQTLGFQMTCFRPSRNCQKAAALARFNTHR